MSKDFLFKNNSRGDGFLIAVTSKQHMREPGSEVELHDVVDSDNREGIIKKTFSLCAIYRSVFGLPRGVQISFSPSDNYADYESKKLVIALDCLTYTTIRPRQQANILLGEFFHESAHFLYTDHDMYKSFYLSNTDKANAVFYALVNIVEDEAIEIQFSKRYPGFRDPLARVREFYFNIFNNKEETGDSAKETSTEPDLLESRLRFVLSAIRYPDNLEEDDFSTHSELAAFMEDYVTRYGYPESSQTCLTFVDKLYEKFFKKPQEEREKQREEQRKNGDSGDDATEALLKILTDHVSGASPNAKACIVNSALGIPKHELEAMVNAVFFASVNDGTDKPSGKHPVGMHRERLVYDDEGLAEVTSKDKVKFVVERVTHDTKERALNAKKHVSVRASAIRNFIEREIRDTKFVFKNKRTGKLDTGKIVPAVCGAQNVYKKTGHHVTRGVVVILLKDESGSMCAEHADTGQPRSVHCMRVAALFNTALTGLPKVRYFEYGFSEEHGDDGFFGGSAYDVVYVYAEDSNVIQHAYGNTSSRGCNRDGHILEAVGKRVREFTDDPCVLFMVSDGQPSGTNYGGNAAKSHVRDVVQKLEKDGIDVVHIAITASAAATGYMYPVVIDYSKEPDLPGAIGNMLRKTVIKKLETDIQ